MHYKYEAPTKNRPKRQSANHLIKALQQKRKLLSSARNQLLEMLQDYEDWQAKTQTIILDIPSIQAKEHPTDEELSSLSLDALSVACPSTTGQELTQMGQQKRQQKMADVEFSLSSPTAAPSGSLWLQCSSQQSTELKLARSTLLAAPQTLTQEERLLANTVFLVDCRSTLQSSITRRGADRQQHQTGAVPV